MGEKGWTFRRPLFLCAFCPRKFSIEEFFEFSPRKKWSNVVWLENFLHTQRTVCLLVYMNHASYFLSVHPPIHLSLSVSVSSRSHRWREKGFVSLPIVFAEYHFFVCPRSYTVILSNCVFNLFLYAYEQKWIIHMNNWMNIHFGRDPFRAGRACTSHLWFRILVPSDAVGAIIGKQGSTVKQIKQTTHAK